jgi:heat shock protein HtpX
VRNGFLTNTLKTAVILAALGGLAVVVGGLLGGRGGAVIGLVLGMVMVGGSYWFSDKLALRSAKAQVITREQLPEFYDMIARLTQCAGMPMPTVAVSPAMQPNAFATGRGPKKAVVCATEGLLRAMPADEVEGVMAHELMHVKHRDILIGSVAAAIATGISFLAQMAMWGAMFGGGSRDDDNNTNPIAAIAIIILAPMAAALMQMAISRSREFEADRGAAELLGSGDSLARALERIEVLAQRTPMPVAPQQAYAYIHNPLAEARGNRQSMRMASLFSTHPATEERIRRLREMTFTG